MKKHLSLIFFFSFIVVLIWFSDKSMLATGEEGMPLYNPGRIMQVYSSPWVNIATGYSMPNLVSRIPFFFFANLIYKTVKHYWLIQPVVMFLLIFSGITGFYFLIDKLVEYHPQKKFVSIASALFYFLNLYSLSQIWNRFLYTGLAAWSLLPTFLLLFIKYVQEGKLRFLVLHGIFSTILSISFGAPSWIITLWTPCALYTFFNSHKPKVISRSLIILLFWVGISTWWLPNYFFLSDSYGPINKFESNIATVRSLSKFFKISNVLLLKDGDFFSSWNNGKFNSDPYSKISVAIFAIMMLGMFSYRGKKGCVYLLAIFFIALFVSKGANPPFGDAFFSMAFKNIPFTASFRNPYEKFGLLILIPYSVFFGLGLSLFAKFFRSLLIFICCFFLAMPLIDGSIYVNYVRVKIPEYIQSADQYLISKKIKRVMLLPHIKGEGVRYTWGYRGLEPSETLFEASSVSKILRAPVYDDFYLSMSDHLVNPSFSNILAVLGVEAAIYRNDLKPDFLAEYDINYDHNLPKKWRDVSFGESFGELDIYLVNKKIVPSRFYLAKNVYFAKGISNIQKKVVDTDFIPKSDIVIDPDIDISPFRSGMNQSQPQISQISPLGYEVKLNNPSHWSILVFQNTFNSHWIATRNDEILNHFVTNGYANGWLIPPGNESDKIEVYFAPNNKDFRSFLKP